MHAGAWQPASEFSHYLDQTVGYEPVCAMAYEMLRWQQEFLTAEEELGAQSQLPVTSLVKPGRPLPGSADPSL